MMGLTNAPAAFSRYIQTLLADFAFKFAQSFVDDLDIDSLSMVEIAMEMDSKLGVGIPDEELKNIKTVGDAVAYVKANS